MNASENRLANRVLIAVVVLFSSALFWLIGSAWISGFVTGKVWFSLVAASVFIADSSYLWLCRRRANQQ